MFGDPAADVGAGLLLFPELLAPLRQSPPPAPTAAPASARPDPPAGHRTCCNCPAVFKVPRGKGKMFCSAACETEYRNLLTARGRKAMLLVMAARQTRDGTRGKPAQREAGRKASARLAALTQEWRDEDRAAGRADAIDIYTLRLALGRDVD